MPAILKYQTTNCANQRDDFEHLLLQAVKQEPVSVVSLTKATVVVSFLIYGFP